MDSVLIVADSVLIRVRQCPNRVRQCPNSDRQCPDSGRQSPKLLKHIGFRLYYSNKQKTLHNTPSIDSFPLLGIF